MRKNVSQAVVAGGHVCKICCSQTVGSDCLHLGLLQVLKDVLGSVPLFNYRDSEQLAAEHTAFFEKWKEPQQPPGTCSLLDDLLAKLQAADSNAVADPVDYDRDAFLAILDALEHKQDETTRVMSNAQHVEDILRDALGDVVRDLKVGEFLVQYAPETYEFFAVCPIWMGKVLEIAEDRKSVSIEWWGRKTKTCGWVKSGWKQAMHKGAPWVNTITLDPDSVCYWGLELDTHAKMFEHDYTTIRTRVEERSKGLTICRSDEEEGASSDSDPNHDSE